MAKNDKKISKNTSSLASGVQYLINSLYQRTYFSSPRLGKDLVDLSKDINSTIDKIQNDNLGATGISNISKLYSRAGLSDAESDKAIINGIQDVFNDTALMDSVLGAYMQNKYLSDLDNEIDTICKYVPRLLEALETRKDNVLSADHFSKDFITVVNKSVQQNEDSLFSDRIEQLKKTYDLLELTEDTYDTASRYGERFIYIVPYQKAINKLLNTKATTTLATMNVESAKIISESADPFLIDKYEPADSRLQLGPEENINIKLEICQSGIVESVVESMKDAQKKFNAVHEQSLNNISEAGSFDRTIDDDLELEGIKDDTALDGLIRTDGKDKEFLKQGFPGCIVKKLERSQVIPIYIEDLCMGYYYIEFKDRDDIFNYTNTLSDPFVNMKSGSKLHAAVDDIKKDYMLKHISGQLSKYIDAKFINSNQDLRKEIYMILKHNDIFNNPRADAVRVTFIPPDDMIHVTFKQDPKTHRGISDLEKALIPAKLYACLYITNVLGIMTRGQDKRVYYVKQQVDTNISKVLLNTINQIKKSNFGIRQIENINSVLNITGRFNDYVIPTGPNGESPVNFEILQGQNIDVKTDLMTVLEEMAINSTDVPIELIQARQSIDYAVQLTMTNSKFLRKVYNRQARYQKFLSQLVTKLYNAEYNEDSNLEVMLPPPMFLNITNTNQVITNTTEYVNSIFEFETADETDEVFKAIYRRDLLTHHLGSYIDVSKHKEIYNRAKMKAELAKDSENQEPQE